MYSSAPKDWFSFHDLPKMTHFSILVTLNTLFSRAGQIGEALVGDCRRIYENEPRLQFALRCSCEPFKNLHRINCLSFTPRVFVLDGSA